MGITPGREEGSWIEQREKLNCDSVVTEFHTEAGLLGSWGGPSEMPGSLVSPVFQRAQR